MASHIRSKILLLSLFTFMLCLSTVYAEEPLGKISLRLLATSEKNGNTVNVLIHFGASERFIEGKVYILLAKDRDHLPDSIVVWRGASDTIPFRDSVAYDFALPVRMRTQVSACFQARTLDDGKTATICETQYYRRYPDTLFQTAVQTQSGFDSGEYREIRFEIRKRGLDHLPLDSLRIIDPELWSRYLRQIQMKTIVK